MLYLYFYLRILLVVLVAIVGGNAWQTLATNWTMAHKLIRTWRTLDTHVDVSKKSSFEKMGVEAFDAKVQGFEKLGFSVQGGCWINTKTEGPLGNARLVKRITRGKKEPAPPIASPNPAPLVVEEVVPIDPLYPYQLTLCCVLVHPELRCQALVMYSGAAGYKGSPPKFGFVGKEKRQIRMQVVSRGQGWQYSTFSGVPPYDWLWRRPRELLTYCGNVNCDTILQTHLARRGEIVRVGKFAWEAPASMTEVIEYKRVLGLRVREWAEHHSTYQLAFLIWQLKRHPAKEWLGELHGEI